LKVEHMRILLLSEEWNDLIPVIIWSNLVYNHTLRHYNWAVELTKLLLNEHLALLRSMFSMWTHDTTGWRLRLLKPLWRIGRINILWYVLSISNRGEWILLLYLVILICYIWHLRINFMRTICMQISAISSWSNFA